MELSNHPALLFDSKFECGAWCQLPATLGLPALRLQYSRVQRASRRQRSLSARMPDRGQASASTGHRFSPWVPLAGYSAGLLLGRLSVGGKLLSRTRRPICQNDINVLSFTELESTVCSWRARRHDELKCATHGVHTVLR
ncbi:hypothetical protein DVH05_028283 [Phytophthora capsici]|nr:hypothetical protein DVH05_028283 [Phytophthora capsici]